MTKITIYQESINNKKLKRYKTAEKYYAENEFGRQTVKIRRLE